MCPGKVIPKKKVPVRAQECSGACMCKSPTQARTCLAPVRRRKEAGAAVVRDQRQEKKWKGIQSFLLSSLTSKLFHSRTQGS
jgi:hypothetical protein